MIGTPSGVTSMIPPHCSTILASRNIGKLRLTSLKAFSRPGVLGSGSRTRQRSKGVTASADQRRCIVTACQNDASSVSEISRLFSRNPARNFGMSRNASGVIWTGDRPVGQSYIHRPAGADAELAIAECKGRSVRDRAGSENRAPDPQLRKVDPEIAREHPRPGTSGQYDKIGLYRTSPR